MGNKRVTQRGLEVVDVIPDQNLLLLRGSVPGPKGGTVEIRTEGPTPDGQGLRPSSSASGKLDLDEAVFGEEFHMALVHEAARAELNARRRGTPSTKTRGEVAMTGAKAFRQKGTGRARAGALSTPQRYGGGVAFGPKPRHYTVKVNRKARRRALRSALSVHADRGSLGMADPERARHAVDQDRAAALGKLEGEGQVPARLRRRRRGHRRSSRSATCRGVKVKPRRRRRGRHGRRCRLVLTPAPPTS